MSAILSPTLALTNAFARFERASARLLDAAQGVGESDLASALIDQRQAVIEVKANVATVRFAEQMWQALLEIGKEGRG